VIPLADDLERTRAPRVTFAATLFALAAAIAALIDGDGRLTALLTALCALWIWVFGRSVEDRYGSLLTLGLVLLGGGGAALIAVAADTSEVWPSWAALGIAFELVAAHLLRFRGAHILCLCLVPYYAGMVMTPAWVWALVGALGAVLLASAGALGG
jgi:membrane associated rhomboid family serine protease